MTITKDGYTDTTGGSVEDQAKADDVANRIYAKVSDDPDAIGLYDEDEIISIRQAYDALTAAQQALVPKEALARLSAAEDKILELNQGAATAVEQAIRDLLSGLDIAALNRDDVEAVAAAKQAIQEAVSAYNGLSDTQKALVDIDARVLLDNTVEEYNSAFSDDPIEGAVDKIQLTTAMVTVANATYNGKAQTPAVTVKRNGTTLVNGVDYTVAHSNNTNAGSSAKVTVKAVATSAYTGTVTKTFTIAKAANPMAAKAKAATIKVKYKKLKKKQTVVALAVSGAQGGVTYKIVKVSAKKKLLKQAKKKIKLAAGGKLALKKKLKKGKYTVTVRVSATGNANYLPATRDVTVKLRVK